MTRRPARIRNKSVKIKMPKLENGPLLQETASVLFTVHLAGTQRNTTLGRALSINLIKNRFIIIKVCYRFAFGNFPL